MTLTTDMSRLVVYDLSGWRGYLFPLIAPRATRLAVVPGENAAQVIARLPCRTMGAFAFHIDLTRTDDCPLERNAFLDMLHARSIRTINARVCDISKRAVQHICVRAGLHTTAAERTGDPAEMLIIKTDRNYGGEPESDLTAEQRTSLRIAEHDICHRADHGYEVLPRRAVPDITWYDRRFVVERYVDNAASLFYRVYFFLDRFAISEGIECARVKTIGRSERQRLLLFRVDCSNGIDMTPPLDLQGAVRAAVRFAHVGQMEFGCLDIVRDDDGQFYVIDMNATPHWGRESELRIIQHLSLNPFGSYRR